jgi:hypothetical protein
MLRMSFFPEQLPYRYEIALWNQKPKLGRMLFAIAASKVGYRGSQPRALNFALLTRLLLFPRFGETPAGAGGGKGFPNRTASHS